MKDKRKEMFEKLQRLFMDAINYKCALTGTQSNDDVMKIKVMTGQMGIQDLDKNQISKMYLRNKEAYNLIIQYFDVNELSIIERVLGEYCDDYDKRMEVIEHNLKQDNDLENIIVMLCIERLKRELSKGYMLTPRQAERDGFTFGYKVLSTITEIRIRQWENEE